MEKGALYRRARHAFGTVYRTWTLHHLYPRLYRKACAETPVKPGKVVFLEVRENALSDNCRLLYRALKKRGGYELKTVCLREGIENRKKVRARCLKAIREVADAQVIFVDDSCYFLSSLPMRPETTAVQVWHAAGAFKKFGYSVAELKFGSDRKELERFPVHRNFSYVTVSSPEVVWAYAEAFHMEDRAERIVPVGVSRTDVFFSEAFRKKAAERLHEAVPQAEGRKVVLYAPTFRGKVAEAASPALPDLGLLREAARQGLEAQETAQDVIFLCKHHPFVKKRPPVPEAWKDFVFDVSEEMTIEDLLIVSDVCITDYSSLIFEYSLMERPMLFYAPDLADYHDWRGFYYPYEEMTPGPVVTDSEELARALRGALESFDPGEVRAFRDKFMSGCDGHATERILRLAFGEEKNG